MECTGGLADRSLRKWHEEGVITDAALAPIEEKVSRVYPTVPL